MSLSYLSLRATVAAIEVAAVNGSTALSTGPHSLCPRKPSRKWYRFHVSEFGGSKLDERRASGTHVLHMKSGVLRLILQRRLVPGPQGACFCESVGPGGCSSGSQTSYPPHVVRSRPLLHFTSHRVCKCRHCRFGYTSLNGFTDQPPCFIKILRRRAMPHSDK